MKYEFKYGPISNEVEDGCTILRRQRLGACRNCGAMTKWFDVLLGGYDCSEECAGLLWGEFEKRERPKFKDYDEHFRNVREELKAAYRLQNDPWKDILIVVRDQLPFLQDCVEGIFKYSRNFTLHFWDNASGPETQAYFESLKEKSDDERRVVVHRSEKNVGFIQPNNELAKLGSGEYIILLNSDCKVYESWDRALVAWLIENPDFVQVGYWGGHLAADGRGFGGQAGRNIDYVPGWCFCISRKTYDQFGLFDPGLQFAYAEDADLSLRLKAAGKLIYSLYSALVYHHQNKTVLQVHEEGEVDLNQTFEHNRQYLVERWKHYLEHERVTK